MNGLGFCKFWSVLFFWFGFRVSDNIPKTIGNEFLLQACLVWSNMMSFDCSGV